MLAAAENRFPRESSHDLDCAQVRRHERCRRELYSPRGRHHRRPAPRQQLGRRRLGDERRHGRLARARRQGGEARSPSSATLEGAARAAREGQRRAARRGRREADHGRVRPGPRRHRQHPEGAGARARGVEPQPRSRLGLRRDLVGAADRRVLQARARQDARRHVLERARRARHRAHRDGARSRAGTCRGRSSRRRFRTASTASPSSRASSRPTRTACRRRSAATAATIPRRSSARCSMPTRCTSGPTSTAS